MKQFLDSKKSGFRQPSIPIHEWTVPVDWRLEWLLPPATSPWSASRRGTDLWIRVDAADETLRCRTSERSSERWSTISGPPDEQILYTITRAQILYGGRKFFCSLPQVTQASMNICKHAYM